MAEGQKKETEVTTVKMEDGRVVEFSGKRKMLKEGFEQDGGLHVRFDFVNGETRTFTIPPSLYGLCALHGASQKIGDEAAGEKTVDDMLTAIENIMARLTGPDSWRAKSESGGFSGAGVVVRALMEVTGKDRAAINAWIEAKLATTEGLTRAKLYASLRATEKLRPVIQRIEEESSKKNAVAGAELLGDLV